MTKSAKTRTRSVSSEGAKEKHLAVLQHYWRKKNVVFEYKWLFSRDPVLPGIHFSCFARRYPAPKGSGSECLKMLTAYSDWSQSPIFLFWDDHELVSYYERHGFVSIKYKTRPNFMAYFPSKAGGA